MNHYLKPLFCLGFLTCAMLSSKAQKEYSSKNLFAVSWEVAVPSSNDYISGTSWSGWRAEYRQLVKPGVSLGLAVSWNAFDEYVNTKTYQSADDATVITTDMIRQVYTIPVTLIAHYYFPTSGKIMQPYFGLGLGAQYAEMNTYFNIYENQETNWGFVAKPEIGTLFRFGSSSPLRGLLSVGYNVATNKNETFDIKSLKQITFNIGLALLN